MLLCPIMILSGQSKTERKTIDSFKKSGYFGVIEMSYGLGIGDSNEHSSFGLQTVNGYLFNPILSLGLGVGIDRLFLNQNVFETTLPIFLDLRLYFLNDPGILFFACEGGYVVNLTGYKEGYKDDLWGMFINPSLGLRIFAFRKKTINLGIGFRIQESTVNYLNMVLPKAENFINFKAGLTF
jgi:hypothetical protein